MVFSRFTTARLDNGTVRVSGPLGFAPQERPMRVLSLHFLLLQDGEVVHGAGGADGGFWDGTAAPAHNLRPGPVQAVGVAVLAATDSADACETYTWSERIELT
jgi:hypothetical protein